MTAHVVHTVAHLEEGGRGIGACEDGGHLKICGAMCKAADVKGWDFVSAHAITQEYTDNLTSIVSLL